MTTSNTPEFFADLFSKWEILGNKDTCPPRLTPFVGSHLLEDSVVSQNAGGQIVMDVELTPGQCPDAVFHLRNPLASFFDLALGAVHFDEIADKARRVQVTMVLG